MIILRKAVYLKKILTIIQQRQQQYVSSMVSSSRSCLLPCFKPIYLNAIKYSQATTTKTKAESNLIDNDTGGDARLLNEYIDRIFSKSNEEIKANAKTAKSIDLHFKIWVKSLNYERLYKPILSRDNLDSNEILYKLINNSNLWSTLINTVSDRLNQMRKERIEDKSRLREAQLKEKNKDMERPLDYKPPDFIQYVYKPLYNIISAENSLIEILYNEHRLCINNNEVEHAQVYYKLSKSYIKYLTKDASHLDSLNTLLLKWYLLILCEQYEFNKLLETDPCVSIKWNDDGDIRGDINKYKDIFLNKLKIDSNKIDEMVKNHNDTCLIQTMYSDAIISSYLYSSSGMSANKQQQDEEDRYKLNVLYDLLEYNSKKYELTNLLYKHLVLNTALNASILFNNKEIFDKIVDIIYKNNFNFNDRRCHLINFDLKPMRSYLKYSNSIDSMFEAYVKNYLPVDNEYLFNFIKIFCEQQQQLKSSKIEQVELTDINKNGYCVVSKRKLNKTEINYKYIIDSMAKNSFINKKYMSSFNAKLLEQFDKFIQNKYYDAVIDGLNVSYYNHHPKFGIKDIKPLQNIRNILKLLTRHNYNRKLLILREYCKEKWDYGYLQSICDETNTEMYFFPSREKDDVFTMHAALRSGPRTVLVSNDKYRDHIYDATGIGQLFQIWHNSVNIGFSSKTYEEDRNRSIDKLIFPQPFTNIVQKIDDVKCTHWYVPFVKNNRREQNELTENDDVDNQDEQKDDINGTKDNTEAINEKIKWLYIRTSK